MSHDVYFCFRVVTCCWASCGRAKFQNYLLSCLHCHLKFYLNSFYFKQCQFVAISCCLDDVFCLTKNTWVDSVIFYNRFFAKFFTFITNLTLFIFKLSKFRLQFKCFEKIIFVLNNLSKLAIFFFHLRLPAWTNQLFVFITLWLQTLFKEHESKLETM